MPTKLYYKIIRYLEHTNTLTFFLCRKFDAQSAIYCLSDYKNHLITQNKLLVDFIHHLLFHRIHKLLSWLVFTNILIACSSGPALQPIQTQQPSPVVSYALSLQGTPYRYGKSSPQEGFDCSGFVKHVYEKQGIFLPRTSGEMANSLKTISVDEINPGDLLFFNTTRPNSHVGIYIGKENFVHAPSQRSGRVMVSSLKNSYWRKHFGGARRPR